MGRRYAPAGRGASLEEPDPGDAGAGREELVAFLKSAPPALQGWAESELAALDAPAGKPVRCTIDLRDGAETVVDLEAAGGEPGEADADVDEGFDEELDEDEDSGAVPRTGTPRRSGGLGRLAGRWLRSRTVVTVAGLAVVAAVVVGVYQAGRSSSVPGINGKADAATSASAAPVDPAKVSALMAKIQTNPKDVASLAALGELYFQSGDYKTAAVWEQKVLAVDPKNVAALVSLGACEFNQGNNDNAEKDWLQVVALDPKQAEAHYGLGFVYLSKNPPDKAKANAEWQKVIDIDPTSALAKTVSTHMQQAGPSASSGAGPSASPSGSASSGGSASPSASASSGK